MADGKGSGNLFYLICPTPPGCQLVSFQAPSWACVSSQSLGSCPCYFNFVFLSLDWFPKWHFGCLGHLEPPLWGQQPQS